MQILTTSKSQHALLNDHIIKMAVNEGEIIDANDIMEMHKIHLKLSENRPFMILLDARKNFAVLAEARALLASDEFIKHHLASAFMVRSLAVKLTGNFFIRFNRPKNATELFSDESEAINWLEEQWRNRK